MAKGVGWIRLHRSSFNNPMYFEEPFTKWQAWCDLLLLANYEVGYFHIRGVQVEVRRGQVGWTVVKLAQRWRWSRGKAKRYLYGLEMEHQIVQQTNNVTTLISILNYDKYNADDTAVTTPNGPEIVQQLVPKTDINKNIINKESINNNSGSGTNPFVTPDSVSGFKYLPDGRSYIEPTVFFKKEQFNGLPDDNVIALTDYFLATKHLEVSEEQVRSLWKVFKIQELTEQKPYRNKEDVYRHFMNWFKKQVFAKPTKEKTSKKKDVDVPEKPNLNLQNYATRYD